MTLSDKQILELNELCNALVDGTISDKQKNRLTGLLANSEDARRYYVRAMGLSSSLISYAGEMQIEAPERRKNPAGIISLFKWIVPLAAAASVATMLWLRHSVPAQNARQRAPAEFVAQLTGLKNSQWNAGNAPLQSGTRLLKGQRIELAGGFAEITFDSGAQVVLEGPATFDLKSAWEATLDRGTLRAFVPPQAIGFRISNPSVQIVDLGTEFTMSADGNGAAEVLVLKGQVEAQPNTTSDTQPIVLREKESRRFAVSGVSDLNDGELKYVRFTQPISLDHFAPPTDCVHWSFDETAGNIFKAQGLGNSAAASDAYIESGPGPVPASAHGTGHRLGDLHFDGHFYAKATFAGITKYAPHTVVFWVKVPKDANLGNAYAMVAWGVNNKSLGTHPIHIGWNRNPNEGTVGVLRTDYGGGYAIGATPLRDGRWHHVAVVLLPRNDANNPLEVNQYVDGRLEGEGKPSPTGSDIFTRAPGKIPDDAVWMGCRLGVNGVRSERFLGEMDELFIADRALEPQEIVSLMNYNQIQIEMAAVKDVEKTKAAE